MKPVLRKLVRITLPVLVITLMVLVGLVEIGVRLTWDVKKGSPGFFIPSETRIEKLSTDYTGWFAGVPVRLNRLGFRDSREYDLAKGPKTFRIIVLGDSVTFGHGSIYEHTYPYLLESRLKAWRPDVDWQVWNLGVPGYNSSQELAYLNEVGPTYKPDLVIVGFYVNDVLDNYAPRRTNAVERAWLGLTGYLSVHSYSYHLYRKAYLTLSAKFLPSTFLKQLSRNLEVEEALLQKVDEVADLKQQAVTPFAPIPDRDAIQTKCNDPTDPETIAKIRRESAWFGAINEFKKLEDEKTYRLVFFNNTAPDVCPLDDLFWRGPTKPLNDYLMGVLGAAAPSVSSYDAYYPYRPSEMPLAAGHSIGNANVVKADVLFEFLKARVLPAALPVAR